MRQRDVKINQSYRLKDISGKPVKIGWAKVKGILQPKEGINKTNKVLAKCEWTQDKDGLIGLIKYFAVSRLCEG